MVYIKRRAPKKAVARCRTIDAMTHLPAAVADGVAVTARPSTTTAATAAATTATTATSPAAATTAATAVAAHLLQTRVNLLLGFRENVYQIASLLRVYSGCQ
jgi:hypothetical protein